MNDDHSATCNCEDCWWARDQKEVCSCCGELIHDTTSSGYKRVSDALGQQLAKAEAKQ